jgi:DNA polymerase-3 subunit beta
MKLTISRRDLLDAVSHIQRVVEARNTLAILSNVAIEADGDRIKMRGTNLDIEARAEAAATVHNAGALTLDAHRLHDIVAKLPDGPVDIEGSALVGSVHLRAGRSKFTLPTLPIEDFPDLSVGEMTCRFDLAADALADMVDATSFAISTEETRYYLNGIYVHVVGDRLTAVATDGHRLARWSCALPDGAADLPPMIVPRKTCAELGRMMKGGTGNVQIEASDTKIRVTQGDTRLTSKLIDGSFPDYLRVIPERETPTFRVARAELITVIDRIRTIADSRGRAIRCQVTPDALTIAMAQDSADAEEVIGITSGGAEDVTIGFNSGYLVEALASLPGDEVAIYLDDPGSPGLVKPLGTAATADPARLVVIMPMRV